MIKLSSRRFAVVLFFQCLVLLIDLVRHSTTTNAQQLLLLFFAFLLRLCRRHINDEPITKSIYSTFRNISGHQQFFLLGQRPSIDNNFLVSVSTNFPFQNLSNFKTSVVCVCFSLQDICLVLAFTVLLFSLYSTYVFQVILSHSQYQIKYTNSCTLHLIFGHFLCLGWSC